jgi:transcription initiation factor TFIID TATA-box-binding protein
MVQKSMNKLDQRIFIRNYRICNILATCKMPFGVRIEDLAKKYRRQGALYEPELMVGLEWAFVEPKANLRIHTTGSVTITGG